MKFFKLSIFNLLLLSSVALFFTSCNKEVDGCTDPNAENYDSDADNEDGSCTYARTDFLGIYNTNENCDSGNWTYSITITEASSSTNGIIISNFGNYGINVNATVTGDNITFNDSQEGATISGSGSISGSTLTIIYSLTSLDFTDSCTVTCIKQ